MSFLPLFTAGRWREISWLRWEAAHCLDYHSYWLCKLIMLFSSPTKVTNSRTPSMLLGHLRGAGRDRCFPEPFSCFFFVFFLHETGLESLKITSAHCFLLKCQRKDSKKAKEHWRFRGILGRWRTAAIDRTTFHACQRCQNRRFAVFSRLWVSFSKESLSWPAMPVSNKKQEFEQRKRIKLFDDFWVRAYQFDFAPRRRPRARSM